MPDKDLAAARREAYEELTGHTYGEMMGEERAALNNLEAAAIKPYREALEQAEGTLDRLGNTPPRQLGNWWHDIGGGYDTLRAARAALHPKEAPDA